jgi:hypothetical protein
MTPGWHVRFGFNTAQERQTTRFLLHAEELLQYEDWTARGHRFIESNPEGIDVAELFLNYAAAVREFDDWLSTNVAALSEPELSDYREYETLVKRIGVRNAWTVLVQLAHPGNLDGFLKQELTPDELAEIESLPPRSRARADRVIELLDEEKVCTDPLRRRAYRAMGVVCENDP